MGDEIRCFFCELKFGSTYKLIPHVFFGHRKKIIKKINKKEDILFKCSMPGCSEVTKAEHSFTGGCKPDDAFISWLSLALLPVERHMNSHTKEDKVTKCEYCSMDLGNTIYWDHIQVHMSGKIDASNASPDKPSQPSQQQPLAATLSTSSRVSGTSGKEPPSTSLDVVKVSSPGGSSGLKQRPPSPPGPPPTTGYSPPASPPLQTAKAPEELAASTIPFSSFFKKKSASPPDSKIAKSSSIFGKDDVTSSPLTPSRIERSLSREESSSVASSLGSSGTNLLTSSTIGSPLTSLGGTSSRLAESMSSISRSSLLDSITSSTRSSHTLPESPQKLLSPQEPSSTTEKLPTESATTQKEFDGGKAKPAEKHKISLSEYAKFRKKQVSTEESPKLPQMQTVEKKTIEVPNEIVSEIESESPEKSQPEAKLRTSEEGGRKVSIESAEVQSLTTKERTLSKPPEPLSTQSAPVISGQKPVGDAVMRPPTPLDQPTTPTQISTTPTASYQQPHHQPKGPTTPTEPSPDGQGALSSRSTTPGGQSSTTTSRPTTPHDQYSSSHHSRSRRTSSDQRSRRPSEADQQRSRRPSDSHSAGSTASTTPKEKTKPVLTEEMERQIIFGGALLKGTKLNVSGGGGSNEPKSEKQSPVDKQQQQQRSSLERESVSPRVSPRGGGGATIVSESEKMPPTRDDRSSSKSPDEDDEKSREEREKERAEEEKRRQVLKRKQEEREKMTREQKLAQVRKEIELRFQEEEQRRIRDKEAQRKHEENLREKIRIEEEKLRKEKEKIALEKRRAKEEKRKAKKAKRKRRHSYDRKGGGRSSEEEPESKKGRRDSQENRRSLSQENNDDVEIMEVEESNEGAAEKPTADLLPPPVSAARPKSPDQYEQLKLNFLSKQKAALEKELQMLDEAKEKEPVESSQNVEGDDEQQMEEDEEDDEDDLEVMMRQYNEKEAARAEAVSSLTMLMSNYEDVDKSQEDETIEVEDDEGEVTGETVSKQNKKAQEGDEAVIIPEDDGNEEQKNKEQDVQEQQIEEHKEQEEDGEAVIQIEDNNEEPTKMDEETLKAATSAAMDIMAPAKRTKRMKAASQLHCSLCKEEEGSSTSYISAYQLLSHVYLLHRKKVVARSRKARGMTLSCPEGCGYITVMSKDGTSIDYFNDELPKHLEMLCDHIRDSHTGEPDMENCQFCSLPLQHKENWSWQHLANHRNVQRFYCNGCNNFPFKNEVHKCPGLGLETYQAGTDSGPDTVKRNPTSSTPSNKTNLSTSEDDVLGKSIEDLERDLLPHDGGSGSAAAANAAATAAAQPRNLANLVRFMCGACDKVVTSLSSWLVHVRKDHLGRGHINYSHDIRCFCCSWMPPRFEKGREIIGVNNLVQHLITEHHSEDWNDPDFAVESNKLVQVQREMERRLEREREEAAIQVPRLPAPCPVCKVSIGQTKWWRYHAIAHRFGEVYCSSCHTFVLGHHFMEHSASCNAEDHANRVKVKIDKYRGDIFLEVPPSSLNCPSPALAPHLDQKYKVTFEYDRVEGIGSITMARTMIGTRVVVGNGSTHDEATKAVREQVENILTDMKVKDEEARKEEIEREDKMKLFNLFKQLCDKDRAEEGKQYFLELGGGEGENIADDKDIEQLELEIPVTTRFYFTKTGKTRIQATAQLYGNLLSAIGVSRPDAVQNLADKVVELQRIRRARGRLDGGNNHEINSAADNNCQNGDEIECLTETDFTCEDCKTAFRKEHIFNLHRRLLPCKN